MPAATRSIDIDTGPDQVTSVITDFSSYPSFLPDMQRVEVLRDSPGDWEVRFTLRLIRELTYTLHLVATEPNVLRWSLVEGMFRANDGAWTLEALDGGSRTRAVYTIDLKVGLFVPGNIVHSLVHRSLPDTLERFKTEAERRARN